MGFVNQSAVQMPEKLPPEEFLVFRLHSVCLPLDTLSEGQS